MIVYRLCKGPYADDLSGRGAEIYGGRWNSIGTPILYTSDSRALCFVEVAARTPFGNIPDNYKLVEIRLPKDHYDTVDEAKLPPEWRLHPHGKFTENIGNQFIKKGENLILKVPSASVEGDFNYLINPVHPHFNKVKIMSTVDFRFDTRLFDR